MSHTTAVQRLNMLHIYVSVLCGHRKCYRIYTLLQLPNAQQICTILLAAAGGFSLATTMTNTKRRCAMLKRGCGGSVNAIPSLTSTLCACSCTGVARCCATHARIQSTGRSQQRVCAGKSTHTHTRPAPTFYDCVYAASSNVIACASRACVAYDYSTLLRPTASLLLLLQLALGQTHADRYRDHTHTHTHHATTNVLKH